MSEQDRGRTTRFAFLTNPGTYLTFAGFVIFSAPVLELAGVPGAMEPGTGSPMLAVTAFFGIVTILTGLAIAVKEREMHGCR